MEFHLYLPQMRMTGEQLVERARAAEAAGFLGIAGMDHLAPPGAPTQPMFGAMPTNAWIAAHTEKLVVGSLVLCDTWRHPAVLAQEAATIDNLSGGRFELGIGWGSITQEIEAYGVRPLEPKERVARLKETLEIVKALWTGEMVDYDGDHFTLRGASMAPPPARPIPITIGGAGPKTMRLVAEHADWWNLHIAILDRFEEMRDRAGKARVSMEHMVAFVPSQDRREEVAGLAMRRFGSMGVFTGNAGEVVDYFGSLGERGVERIYAWFTDFAQPETLAQFGETVIPALR